MNALLIAVLGALGGIALGVCSDMISEEMRARLDRLPQAIIGLAVLRLPKAIREETRHDWLADLDYFLHGDEAVPVTRLFKGVGFSVGLFFSASEFGRELGVHEVERDDPIRKEESSVDGKEYADMGVGKSFLCLGPHS